jgi:ferredoxin
MANKEDRYQDNIPGKYYVDSDCIACDTCVGLAKKHFMLTADHDHAVVKRQPVTPQEIEECELTLHACPVGAIGNDGDTCVNG